MKGEGERMKMRTDFKTILVELKEFVDCYVKHLKARNSFRQSRVDVILYIEKYTTLKLQKETVALMFEQARSFMNEKAVKEVEKFLKKAS